MTSLLPPYTLKRSRQSRHIRVSVKAGGRVIVTAPFHTLEVVIKSFLLAHASWLHRKVKYFKEFPVEKLSVSEEKKLFAAYKTRAHSLALAKVVAQNKRYGFSFKKVAVRNSRTRWGSCSSKGTLSFNYKIVFLPEHLADYLVVHELCHLKEPNHSSRFWSLVCKTTPTYPLLRKELRVFERTFKPPVIGI